MLFHLSRVTGYLRDLGRRIVRRIGLAEQPAEERNPLNIGIKLSEIRQQAILGFLCFKIKLVTKRMKLLCWEAST